MPAFCRGYLMTWYFWFYKFHSWHLGYTLFLSYHPCLIYTPWGSELFSRNLCLVVPRSDIEGLSLEAHIPGVIIRPYSFSTSNLRFPPILSGVAPSWRACLALNCCYLFFGFTWLSGNNYWLDSIRITVFFCS